MENDLFKLSHLERIICDIKKSLVSEKAILADILNLQSEKFSQENMSRYKSYELTAINNSVSQASKNIIRLQTLLQNNLLHVERLLQTLERSEDEEE